MLMVMPMAILKDGMTMHGILHIAGIIPDLTDGIHGTLSIVSARGVLILLEVTPTCHLPVVLVSLSDIVHLDGTHSIASTALTVLVGLALGDSIALATVLGDMAITRLAITEEDSSVTLITQYSLYT